MPASDIHLKAFGLYRDFLDNVNDGATTVASTFARPGGYTSSSNQNTSGYGFGAGIIVPVLPRKLDFQASGLVGRGMAVIRPRNFWTRRSTATAR